MENRMNEYGINSHMDRLQFTVEQMRSARVDQSWLKFIQSDRPAIIYGAGKQARIVIDFCHMFGKEIFCLMATNSRNRWGASSAGK